MATIYIKKIFPEVNEIENSFSLDNSTFLICYTTTKQYKIVVQEDACIKYLKSKAKTIIIVSMNSSLWPGALYFFFFQST